jgi:peptidoglycan/LPS O-acetylase OafA/YrhL
VISGFLITSILTEELARGRLDFGAFYARRVRRIFPALAVVLASCLVIGAILLDPSEYEALGLHVAAGAAFLSNALSWFESGYFDEAAEFKPLLHLWSLAVEEQFYILWPLALWFCARLRRPLCAAALVLGGLSFALCLQLSGDDRVAAFYFVLSRIWEPLLGGMLALVAPRLPRLTGASAHGVALIGAALIVVSLKLIDSSQAFPGWRALGPTVGATLLIAAGPRAFVNARLLSLRPMVALGKISYPLYLWHWPLLTFERIRDEDALGPPVRWGLIFLSIGLAQLTYVYVEKPIRLRPRGVGLAAITSAIIALGLAGLRDYDAGGLFWTRSAMVKAVHQGDIGQTEFRAYIEAHSRPCQSKLTSGFVDRDKNLLFCAQSIADTVPEIMFVGDSHAEHYFLGMAEALPGRNVGYYFRNALPLLDDPRFASAYHALAEDPKARTIILSAYWLDRRREIPKNGSLRDELNRVVRFLRAAGKRVFILNDVPTFPFRPAVCKYAGRLGVANHCEVDIAVLERQLALYSSDLDAVAAANPGVRVLDTAHMLCAGAVCSMASGDKLLFRDAHHFNIIGSRLIGARLLAAYPDIAE